MSFVNPLITRIEAAITQGQRIVWATDFDGTVAPYVDFNDEALPAPGVRAALEQLRAVNVDVVFISGRPVHFLRTLFGDMFEYFGTYGAESFLQGEYEMTDEAKHWTTVVAEAGSELLIAFEQAGVPAVYQARQAADEAALFIERKPVTLGVFPFMGGDHGLANTAKNIIFDLDVTRFGLEAVDQGDQVLVRPQEFQAKFDKASAMKQLVSTDAFVIFSGDDPSDVGCAQLASRSGGICIGVDNRRNETWKGTPPELLDSCAIILGAGDASPQEHLAMLMTSVADRMQ